MPERDRAYLGEEVVTVLSGKIGGRGKTQIRNSFGFVQDVQAKDLKPIPPTERGAVLKFEDASD